MQTHIQKWGNSLGIRIPKAFSKQLHLNPGREVTIEMEGDKIMIHASRYSLNDMLDQITQQNLHPIALDDEIAEGQEEW